MTLRQYYAGLAMQGILTGSIGLPNDPAGVSCDARLHADALSSPNSKRRRMSNAIEKAQPSALEAILSL